GSAPENRASDARVAVDDREGCARLLDHGCVHLIHDLGRLSATVATRSSVRFHVSSVSGPHGVFLNASGSSGGGARRVPLTIGSSASPFGSHSIRKLFARPSDRFTLSRENQSDP